MSNVFEVHHTADSQADTRLLDPHQDAYSRTLLGFWLYLMSDCLLFGALFATYAVLHHETFGGPTSKDIFDLTLAFHETLILLCSSLFCGFSVLAALHERRKLTLLWLGMTFLLGAWFIFLELNEFAGLIYEGYSWETSAFLSSFFTLVGTHGLHVISGLLWASVMIGQIVYQGINSETFRRLTLFSLFWHFLDLIWIFIFTFVYLIGVLV
ncbi:MAG: cytochrome o ubiquinol oxidase subunit III [Parachlamydia sp.]|jgi:cytochrome o ubiquinol oxidase subunit 3|nr:cytochrome o ubiquinol oxidase subunit III [Parachlamydia sp.]